mgnify:CR=1 FL=1
MSIDKIAAELGKVKSKYGIFSCIGNHDVWFDLDAVTNALEKNNIKVLYNSNAKIKTNKKARRCLRRIRYASLQRKQGDGWK